MVRFILGCLVLLIGGVLTIFVHPLFCLFAVLAALLMWWGMMR